MGAPFKFTAAELHELFTEYLKQRASEYDVRYEVIKSGELAGTVIEIKLPKVPTIASFCHFIGSTEKSFYEWLHGEKDTIPEDLIKFVTRVREVIKDKQLSGAMNNVYNATITSRMNNLSDQLNIEHSGDKQSVNITIDGTKLDLTR